MRYEGESALATGSTTGIGQFHEDVMLELVIFFGHFTMVSTSANTFGLGVASGRPGCDGVVQDQDVP